MTGRRGRRVAIGLGAFAGATLLVGAAVRLRPLLLPGNGPAFAPHPRRPDSGLSGLTAYVLGSSVAFGSAARGVSFADDLAATYGVRVTKQTVPGTTLSTARKNCYVERLELLPQSAPDVLIVQVSTNDAAHPRAVIGSPSDVGSATAAGALVTIVRRARARWGADLPVVLFTGSRFSPRHRARRRYEDLVAIATVVATREGATVLDLYTGLLRLPGRQPVTLASFTNDLSADRRALLMSDDIHPTRAGYRDWWTPAFVEALSSMPALVRWTPR